MSLTIPEAHAEIRRHYEAAKAIQDRHDGIVTQEKSPEDYIEVRRLLTEIDGLEAKLSSLEDAQAHADRIKANAQKYLTPAVQHRQPDPNGSANGTGTKGMALAPRAFAEQFVESKQYADVLESGALNSPSNMIDFSVKLDGSLLDHLMQKALVYSGTGVAGPLVRPERVPGIDYLYRQTTLLDMIPTGTTNSSSIEYYEMTTSTNNAATVAEATLATGATGLKPEAALAWALRSLPVATIAEHIPVTNQMLSDASFVRGIIEQQLLTHLQITLENQVLTGNGTAPNLLGILSNPGINTIGLGAGSGSAIDAVYRAMTVVMVTGLRNPTASVWNPLDFEAVRLARENAASATLGQYLIGPPSVAGPLTLWGRPVVLAIGMTADTALVADFTAMQLFDREQAAIRTGWINDQFTRNMQTILAELRAVFALFRPSAVCRVTGV